MKKTQKTRETEDLPKNAPTKKADYLDYLQNPNKRLKDPDERELLAYEVGRLSSAEKRYGIDFKEGYDYQIGGKVKHMVDKNINSRY